MAHPTPQRAPPEKVLSLRFAPKTHLLGHMRSLPTLRIVRPLLGQVQLSANRPVQRSGALELVGHVLGTHHHLAVGSLAQNAPQYWRATPTEDLPCLGKEVSSNTRMPPPLGLFSLKDLTRAPSNSFESQSASVSRCFGGARWKCQRLPQRSCRSFCDRGRSKAP
jgi:hypothetical protein